MLERFQLGRRHSDLDDFLALYFSFRHLEGPPHRVNLLARWGGPTGGIGGSKPLIQLTENRPQGGPSVYAGLLLLNDIVAHPDFKGPDQVWQ